MTTTHTSLLTAYVDALKAYANAFAKKRAAMPTASDEDYSDVMDRCHDTHETLRCAAIAAEICEKKYDDDRRTARNAR